MISIITSSFDNELFYNFSENVKKTIGLKYEIIRIFNPGNIGICKAYNEGACKSNFDLLLFVHDDIEFLEKGWGLKLIKLLQNPLAGIIGVAGSVHKSKMISSWHQRTPKNIELARRNYIQDFKYTCKSAIREYANPLNEIYSAVVTVDGLLMGVRKEVWNKVKFDESIIGFHAYDLDFSLSVSKYYTNYVTYDIAIRHLSEGNLTFEWFNETVKVNNKHIGNLPKSTIYIDKTLEAAIETKNLIYTIILIEKLVKKRYKRLLLLSQILFQQKFYKITPRIIYRTFMMLCKK